MRAFIFGAGRYGREIAERIMLGDSVELIGFLDNYAKDPILKWGGTA